MPSDKITSIHKEKLKVCMKAVCENLNVSQIIPSLLGHSLIVNREAETLIKIEKNESKFEAAMELVLKMLPNRSEHWYAKFVVCLIDSDHEFLARKVDEKLCDGKCKMFILTFTFLEHM